MKLLLIYLALFAGQINAHREKPVVRLRPHGDSVSVGLGGKILELMNAPNVISLPAAVPKLDDYGVVWSVEIKNLGPRPVTVVGKGEFSKPIGVGQTIHIYSNGTAYSTKP